MASQTVSTSSVDSLKSRVAASPTATSTASDLIFEYLDSQLGVFTTTTFTGSDAINPTLTIITLEDSTSYSSNGGIAGTTLIPSLTTIYSEITTSKITTSTPIATSTVTNSFPGPGIPLVLLGHPSGTVPGVQASSQTTTTGSLLTVSATNTTSLSPSAASAVSASKVSASIAAAASKSAVKGLFNTGSLVGAAIGCLIGGAFIAGFLVWLIMSSQLKKQRRAGGFADKRQSSGRTNSEKVLPTEPLLGGAAAWEQHLPQSESDGTIRGSIKALFDQIDLHVENFYRDASVNVTPLMQSELMKVDSNNLPDSVVGKLPQTRKSTTLIKHCLSQMIVSHISAEGGSPNSFLPVDFIALPQALGNSRTNSNKPAFAQALSRWRVLSSYLRPRAQDDRSYLTQRDSNIAAAADVFCAAWTPWAMGEPSVDRRRQHLINIMKAAADTGILIFSQPSSFAYRWTAPAERDRKGANTRVVVSPGFIKITDEQGKDLGARGQTLLEPAVETL